MRRSCVPVATALLALGLGCHREPEMVPLIEKAIYITDRFYDVQALSTDRAFIVGYGGKIIETTDGGRSWEGRPSGIETALYAVRFTDGQHGWVVGQEGVVLHTADGGKSWQPQESNAIFKETDGGKQNLYLFGLDALDNDHAWAVGDRSILVSTSDGGKTWRARQVPMEADLSGGETLAAADPIFYDVKFTDMQHGWIVGEFGKIMHTEDGGETWHEQEGRARGTVEACQARPGHPHLAARHGLLRPAAWVAGGRLRVDLSHHRRRQKLAAVARVRTGARHE